MEPAPIPADEVARLAALRALGLLDTAAEERFDRLTRLAAAVFDCPIALVSLVDRDRQWFKSCIGLDARETPRDISFCGHAIHHDEALVVRNALADPRFADNPLVTAAPAIRFYAGQPLHSPSGHRIGTLCVIDRAPHEPTTIQLTALADLGRIVENELGQLELRDALATSSACAAELDRHSRTLDTILRLTPDAFIAFDEDGLRTYGNRALVDLVGDAIAGCTDYPAFDQALSAAGRPPPGRRRMARSAEGITELEISSSGQFRVLQRSDRAVLGADGVSQGRVVFLRDITHEYEVDRMKTEFLSIAAHELRTPMASIHGFAELLLKRDYDAETRRDLLETIYRQSTNLSHLINELLDIARIEARAGADFRIAAQPLNPLLARAIETAAPPGEARRIRSEIPAELPRVLVDGEKFCQALVNVITNALKYSGADAPVHLGITGPDGPAPGMLGIAVRDEGIGMTPEQLDRVFERFYRAEQSGRTPGAGLGMSLVKEIIDLHGGRIDIASLPDRGTTVTLWIPCAPPTTP